MRNRLPAVALVVAASAIAAAGQSVISTHAGLIHYFEGAVYLGPQRLEQHLGTFPVLPQGGELRTAEGKAEVLLTPDVFLRLGDRSSIRMIANDLANPQVELEAGSAIIDAEQADPDTSANVIFKNWRIHFMDKGVYRIDSDPPRLLVTAGEAEVFAGSDPQPVSVQRGMNLPLAAVLVADAAPNDPGDSLTEWSKGRDQSISSDNAILAQLDQDPGSDQAPLSAYADPGVTYYPMIGLMPPLSPGLSASLYSSLYPTQPGFNSIYMPGYTYLPLYVGLIGSRAPMGRYPTTLSHPTQITRPIQPLITPLPAIQRPLTIAPMRTTSPPPMVSRPPAMVAPPRFTPVAPRPVTPVPVGRSVGARR